MTSSIRSLPFPTGCCRLPKRNLLWAGSDSRVRSGAALVESDVPILYALLEKKEPSS